MKVLWLCNLVVYGFENEFGIPRSVYGGWINGMLEMLKNTDVEIALCMPIIDRIRLRDGVLNGTRYYTFNCDYDACEYEESGELMTERFVEIINDYYPDVIHIWGTEYLHSLSMIEAAKRCNLVNRTVVYIQGLISELAKVALNGVPEEYASIKSKGALSLHEQVKNYERRGMLEKEVIKKSRWVIGRTDWDRANVFWMNQKVGYCQCGEVLRPSFYEVSRWKKKKRDVFYIFMTQGTYPVKGIHFVVQAIAILSKCIPNIKLEIAGGNILDAEELSPYARYLHDLITRQNLDKCIDYIGPLDERGIINKMLDSDVYLLSSLIENSPNSLCEAMMLGVPAVASYVGGVPTIIGKKDGGILYKYDDPKMLAWALYSIYNQDVYISEMSEKEHIRAMEICNRVKNRDRLINIYRMIVDECV